MGQPIVVIKDAYKTFANGFRALDCVNLSLEGNKIHGIIGRNGSGKTVLMKCICGLMKLSSGSIDVNGKTVGRDIDFPDQMGLIIETPGFLPNYSGIDNLKMLAMLKGRIKTEQIEETMHIVGLDPNMRKKVKSYSLGMRQRLGIAQAIMEDPDILLLDEPMNGLDNKGVEDVRCLLLSLRDKGKTILLASHNKQDIALLCDTVCEMDAGTLIQQTDAAV